MRLEVYALVILSSLSLLVVAVNASDDFGEKSGLVYLRNKQVSKSALNEVLFINPFYSFFFLFFLLSK